MKQHPSCQQVFYFFLQRRFWGQKTHAQFRLSIKSGKASLALFRLFRPAGFKQNRKELNFAPVAPTSAHTESIFSVVFEIGLMCKL